MEIRRIQKSGNSLYVTLPRTFLCHIGLKRGDYARVILRGRFIEVGRVGVEVREGRKWRKKKLSKSR